MGKLKTIMASVLMSLVMSVIFFWVMINFITGCGDNYYNSKGQPIAGECVAMPWVTYQGGEIINE
ncbi:MAG: hypothetical protein HOE35_07155 [Candidatus Ruthia sp.]|jgi:hypothetical protein|nr:hypothetical protein [Candidatus Ruthturnera sp.]